MPESKELKIGGVGSAASWARSTLGGLKEEKCLTGSRGRLCALENSKSNEELCRVEN